MERGELFTSAVTHSYHGHISSFLRYRSKIFCEYCTCCWGKVSTTQELALQLRCSYLHWFPDPFFSGILSSIILYCRNFSHTDDIYLWFICGHIFKIVEHNYGLVTQFWPTYRSLVGPLLCPSINSVKSVETKIDMDVIGM